MGASRRLDLALKIGVLAAGIAAAVSACGSISVEHPDGSTGTGGMPASGTGGATAGGVGGHGGGAGGHLGTGGIIIIGGSGGVTGGGTGGGTGAVTCADIQRDFVLALADARSCNIGGVGQCALTTNDRLDCGCPTPVNRTDKVDVVRQAWIQNSCSSGICPAKPCSIVAAGACALSASSGQPVCQ
jgi:hypothetical protein